MSYALAGGSSGSRNTGGLIVTVAVHAVLGLAALYGLGVVEVPHIHHAPPIKIRNIPEKLPQTTPPKVEPDLKTAWDLPPPVITIAPVNPPLITPLPPVNPPPAGNGTGTGVIDVPPLNVVLVDARIDPRFADRFQPPYPPGSLRREEEGVVILRVLIGPDGRVKTAELATSSGFDRLDEAAVAHAKRAWRFVPATKGGAPVETWLRMSVRFQLTQG